LRSGAVNVGGVKLCQTLTSLRDVSSKELSTAQVEKIESELSRLDLALDEIVGLQRRG
jgi:hypothetical protein